MTKPHIFPFHEGFKFEDLNLVLCSKALTRCMLRAIIATIDEGGGAGVSKVKDES